MTRSTDPRPETQKRHETRLRQQGYQDAVAGRASASEDPIYRTSYRRGLERAEQIRRKS